MIFLLSTCDFTRMFFNDCVLVRKSFQVRYFFYLKDHKNLLICKGC